MAEKKEQEKKTENNIGDFVKELRQLATEGKIKENGVIDNAAKKLNPEQYAKVTGKEEPTYRELTDWEKEYIKGNKDEEIAKIEAEGRKRQPVKRTEPRTAQEKQLDTYLSTKMTTAAREEYEKIGNAAQEYVKTVTRNHTFTEEENGRKAIDNSILEFKKKYPTLYDKHREEIDKTVKYAINKDYRTGVSRTRSLYRNVDAYNQRSGGNNKSSDRNAELARKSALADIEYIKKYAPEYFKENATALYALYAGMITTPEEKDLYGQMAYDEILAITGSKEDAKNARRLVEYQYNENQTKKIASSKDFKETVERGWNFGSSEAQEKAGIKARGSYTPEQNTDMQRFGNPLIYLFDSDRMLTGTNHEKAYDGNYKQTEAEFFGRNSAHATDFFDGLIANGTSDDGKHNLALYMTQEEKDAFTYLYMKDIDNGIKNYSESNAKKYFDMLSPELEARITSDVSKQMKDLASENFGGALALRTFNLLANAGASKRVAAKLLSEEETDENNQLFLYSNANNAMQEEWFKDLNDTEKFFAGIGLSVYDNLAMRIVTGGTKYNAVLTPSQVFTSTAHDSVSKGLSNKEALAMSSILAASEAITETIKFDKIDAASDAAKVSFVHSKGVINKAKEIAKIVGYEGVVGGFQELTNEGVAVAAEIIFSGDEARIRKYYNDYVEKHGEKKANAVWSVALTVVKDMTGAFTSGFITEVALGTAKEVNDATVASNLVKSAGKESHTTEIGKRFNNPKDVSNILKKAISSDNGIVKALGENVKGRLDQDNLAKELANDLGNEKYTIGVLDDSDAQLMYDFGLLVRAVDSEAADAVYKQILEAETNATIDTAAESAIDSAIADVAKVNSESTARTVENFDNKKPSVTIKTDGGQSVVVNGEYTTKIQGRKIYTVRGTDFGGVDAYYAIDSETGRSIASGEAKTVIREQLNVLKESGKTSENAVFDDGTENIFAGEVDVPIDFDSLERNVPVAKPEYKTFEGTDVEDIFSVDDVEVAEVGSPAEVDETVEKSGDEKIVVPEKKVDKVTYERAFTERKTTAVSESELSGDDVEVGKTITHSDLTQAVIDQALNSNDAATIKAAKDIQRRVYKNTDEMYRAVGRLAKAVGITGNDVIQSRAASIAQRYNDSNFGSTYAEFSNDLRQKFELAGDEIGIQALDYLDSIQAKSGQTGIDTVATDGIEYSESNRNRVVENYISGIQYAFRANGNKNTRFEVYYDNSENAKRGEWKVDSKGNVTIRINGAKVRGAESATWVLTHELFHGAAKNNPGIVDRVIDTFREIGIYDDSKFDAYKAEYEAAEGKELTDEYIKEEIAADLMMDVMGNEELTAMFAQKSTKEDLNFIARFFRRFVDAIKKVFDGNKKYQQYVYDAEKLLGVFERAIKADGNKKISGVAEARNAFAGKNAETANHSLLEEAMIMSEQGKSAAEILKDTGWYQGADGKWRFEIDDSKLEVSTSGKFTRNPQKRRYIELFDKVFLGTDATEQEVNEFYELNEQFGKEKFTPAKLGDLIKHPDLFKAYPELEDVNVAFVNTNSKSDGSYDPILNGIVLERRNNLAPEKLKDVLVHEIQHAIQNIEDFARGSSPGYWQAEIDIGREDGSRSAYELYKNTAGEIEAREAAGRRKLSGDERREKMPFVKDENTVFAESSESNGRVMLSEKEIIGESGKSYGIGVYLDSDKLTETIDEDARIRIVKDYVKKIGGNKFIAYDNNGNAVDVHIAKASQKFVNKNKKQKHVNNDLTSYLKNEVKQEAIVLVDELIANAKHKKSQNSKYPHGWVDNYGKNNWDYWKVFIQEKNKTVWEATLNIANSTNGEKILYDIYPIEMVERSVTSDTTSTKYSISDSSEKSNGKIVNNEDTQTKSAVTSTPANENSVFDDKQRKDVIRKLSAVAKQNGVARLDKDSFVTDAMGILEGALQTGIVSDGVVDELARCLYDYSREDAGDADLAGTYKDIRERINKIGKIYVPESVKNDIPDYDAFRKQFGTLLTTTDETALEVDKLYNDLKMDYPDIFTKDLVAGDQLQKLADILTEARKYKANDGLTHTSEIHSFDDVKTDFVEMADEILDNISASVGIELVEESDVYAELAESGKDISSIEIPNELIMKDKLSDKQIQALLQKVKDRRNEYMYVQEGDEGSRRVKKYPNADKEYKFLQRLFSAETEYKEAQKKLRDAEKKSKSRDAEVDNKRLTDFTKGIANAFGFGGDTSKTADVGRGLKGLYDAVSEYIKTGDDAALNKMVASVGSIAEKIADYSTSDVDIDKVGGYILDSFSNVAKGARGDVAVASANDIASLENGTMAALEGVQSVAEADYSGEVEAARKALYDATAKLRAQQVQPYFETVMDKFFDMQEAEIAAAEARFEKELADERAKGEEAVEAEKAKAEDRVVGEKMGYEREATEARRKSDEKLAEERTKRREEVAEVRKRSKERVEKMREDAREARERKSEKRNRRKKEEKLLRVINRLRKVKTNAETQEIIKNVIGNLDYLGISIMDDNKIRLEKLRERYLEKSQDENFIREPGIEERLSRLDNRQISDLSADELAHILEMATALEHQIAYDKSVMIHEQAVSKYRAARSGISGVLDTKGAKYDKAIPGAWNKYSTSLRAPRRFFKKIFGYDKNNKMFQLTEEINNGQKKSLMIHQESERPFTALTLDKEIKKFTGKKATEYDTGITTIKGTKIKITPAQKVALYLSAKNHDFLRHAAGGGIKFPDIKLLKDGKVKEAYAKGETVSLKPSEIHRITSGLTAYEQRWADAAEKYFNETSRKYINEASLEMYGYEIANVENYFPIMTNKNFNATEPESLVRNATLEGKGFLKDRVHASNQVLLEDVTSVLERHIKDVSDFAGLSAPIKNFSKAYTATVNYADGSRMSVREAIEQTWGPAATKYIDNLLSDLQTPRKAERGWAEKLRSKRAAAIMTMNIPVTLGNFANYFHAGSKVGAKALVKGIFGGKVDTEIVAKYTPYLEARMQGYTTKEFGDVAKGDSFGVKKSLGAKIVNMMQFVDILCTKATWNASKAYVDSNFSDLKKGSDEYYKAVAKVFDGIIEDTQVNDLVYQKADILKSTNFFVNELTMFKSELLKNLDMIRDAGGECAATVRRYGGLKNTLREAKRGNKEVRDVLVNTRRVMVSQATAMVFVQVVDALVKGLWFKKWSYKDEEEDEVTADSLIETGIEQFFMGFLAMFPGAEDTVNLFGNLAKGAAGLAGIEIPVDFEWYGMNANVFEMINDFADGATNIIDTIGKYQKGDVSEKSLLVSGWDFLSENIAPALGVPSENIENLVKGTVLNVVEASGGKYYGKYQRYKYEEDGASYYTRQKMISTALKAKNAGDMDAYNAIREDMIKSKFASAKTFDKGIENLETAIELGTYGDVFKKAVEYDEKAGNVYERDGSGEAAFRYEVAHHDRYFAENAVELVKDLPKDKQDEALSIAAELIRSSDHKKTRGQQLVIDNFNAVGDEGIFKFSAEYNDMSKTVDGEKKTADFEFDDYVSYAEEYRDATEYLRLAIFGTDKDVADYGKAITDKYAGEAWLMYAKDAPADDASDKEKAEYYKKASKEAQYAILDKYKAKYFGDYGADYEVFGDIESGRNVASDLYTWDESGKNAYSKEIYSKADDLIGKAEVLIEDLPESERDEAMQLVTDYAKGFAYTERKGGTLLAEAYDRVYGGVEDPELRADSVFDMYSEYSNISKTVDGKKYKSDFTVGDYIEYNKEIADADELVRLALFGGKGSAEAKELKAKYKNEPWMKLVEAAEGKSSMSDKEKLELYTDIRNDITNNIKMPYEHKYIKATSSGNADIDNFFVERDAAYNALDYSKDDNGEFTDGESKGKYNYYSRTNSYVNNSLDLIDKNPLLSAAQKKEQKDKLGEYVRGLKYSPTKGQKYIMAEFDDYAKSAEEYNKYIDAEISRTGDNTLEKMHWDSAESKTTSKSKDSIPYTVTYSQPQYAEMVDHMNKGEEYAALYIFGTDKELREYKATLTATEKAWVNEGVSELNKEAKKIDKYIAKGILSKESRDAYLYYALVGKIKSAVRAGYRETVFDKYRKDADTPKGYYVKYNP